MCCNSMRSVGGGSRELISATHQAEQSAGSPASAVVVSQLPELSRMGLLWVVLEQLCASWIRISLSAIGLAARAQAPCIPGLPVDCVSGIPNMETPTKKA